MTDNALRRLKRDWQNIRGNRSPLWSMEPTADIFRWKGSIQGLDGVHAGKKYNLEMIFPENYPFKAPLVRFISRIDCENVYRDGELCLDILNDAWSPALNIERLMTSICSVITDAPQSQTPYKKRPRRRTELELLGV